MTEQEFNETIGNMDDIYDFCTENPQYDYITDDVYNSEAMADYIKDVVRHINFEDVHDFLTFADAIPDSEWYHVQDGCMYELSFEELKYDLLDKLRSDGFFTDEELTNSDNNQNSTDMWVDINSSDNNTNTDDDIVANDISLLYS